MKYLITGSGYLAKHLISALLEKPEIEKIKIFSRAEKEQWEVKTHFNNNPKLEFVIGDIRDYQAINDALVGIDYCIHTGAIKRIEVAEKQPMEAIKTNVLGSMNVINAAIANKVKKLILISTDKATSATTCYGSTKFLMECMAYANESDTDIICTRYGNVFGSTGSVVPIFDNLVKQNKPLTVRNGNMTRFFMPVSACVDIILDAIELGQNGELWVYKSKSCTIKDLADAFSNNQIITGTENIEKNDEALVTISELNHSRKWYDYYVIRKDYISEQIYDEPLTSYTADRLTQEEIKQMIDDWRNCCEI
jgi:UDP-glucose 4-epimerase